MNGDHAKGIISEEIAVIACLMRGEEVARPVPGMNLNWDLLAKIDGAWRTIQVKSARKSETKGFSVECARTVKRKEGTDRQRRENYKDGDFDLLMAVYTPSGRVWRLPFSSLGGRMSAPLKDQFILHPGAGIEIEAREEPILPLPMLEVPYFKQVITGRKKSAMRKMALELDLTSGRPGYVSEPSWEMLLLFRDGYSFEAISARYEIHPITVRERLVVAIRAIELYGEDRNKLLWEEFLRNLRDEFGEGEFTTETLMEKAKEGKIGATVPGLGKLAVFGSRYKVGAMLHQLSDREVRFGREGFGVRRTQARNKSSAGVLARWQVVRDL